jgi:hypothetical protein
MESFSTMRLLKVMPERDDAIFSNKLSFERQAAMLNNTAPIISKREEFIVLQKGCNVKKGFS